jgi:hypothetical protein
MRTREIEKLLQRALLKNGKMEIALYEHELEEHIEYWYAGLQADDDELVFAITENSGDVAMVLVTKEKNMYLNEKAREKLQEFWPQPAYDGNMKLLIPMMADELANDIIAVNGVKVVADV